MLIRNTLIAVVVVLALGAVSAGAESPGVVNVNTASAEQLQLLPRVGPALAERIIDIREANGPFNSVEDLTNVKGIGEKILFNNKDRISVAD